MDKKRKIKANKKMEKGLKLINEFNDINSLTDSDEVHCKKTKLNSESSVIDMDKKRKIKAEKKMEEALKLINEFKGINSLTDSDEVHCNKTKLNTESSEAEVEKPVNEKIKIKKKNYILIQNLHDSVSTDDMKKYLNDNGVSFDNVMVLPGSLGIAHFQRPKEVEKLLNVCQGQLFKTNELFIFKSDIDSVNDKCVSNMCTTSVHLKNIDSSTGEDDIISILSNLTIKNIFMNNEKGTAIIDFIDSQSSKAAIELLDNKLIGDKIVRASFLVKTQRPDVFTLKVSNVPKHVTVADVQAAVPIAAKIKFQKKKAHTCLLHFKSAEDMNSVLNGGDLFIKDQKVKVEQLLSKIVEHKTQYILNLFNMPFDTTLAEIKEHYADARYIEMQKNESGQFVGSAKLMYDDKEVCEEALKRSKGLTFKHRRLRSEMKVEEGSKIVSKEDNAMELDE